MFPTQPTLWEDLGSQFQLPNNNKTHSDKNKRDEGPATTSPASATSRCYRQEASNRRPFLFGNIKFTLRACAKFTIKYSQASQILSHKKKYANLKARILCMWSLWLRFLAPNPGVPVPIRTNTFLPSTQSPRMRLKHERLPLHVRYLSLSHNFTYIKLPLATELNTHVNHNKNIEWPKHEISSTSINFNLLQIYFYQE